MRFLVAIKFLTIVPLLRQRQDSLEEIGGSIAYFPAVGLIIGLYLAALNWLFNLFLPPAVVSGLLIVALVTITGALHLDGFIDTCDGIAGHKSVEARWRVMRDSRTGAFGVVGAVLLLLVKYATLNSVPESSLTATLMLVPVLGRWAMVYTIFAYAYARPEGLGKTIKQAATWQTFTTATVMTLALAVGLSWLTGSPRFYLVGPTIMLVAWVIIVIVASYFKGKFAGLTGDNYGAINEITEVVVVILVIVLAHNHWLI